jgi:ATP adenylyltransferase
MTIVIPNASVNPAWLANASTALTFTCERLLLRPFSQTRIATNHMQQLHAYWRMEYIEAPRYPAAMQRPFAELPALGDDRAALIVHRSALSYLILNRFPYNPGHLLAVPFREVTDLEQLTAPERADLFEEIIFGQRILSAALKPEGFNIGFNLGSAVAGGSIAHLHGHIVPRWNGDNNFMPVVGQTRILPQSLGATWEKLDHAARELAGATNSKA